MASKLGTLSVNIEANVESFRTSLNSLTSAIAQWSQTVGVDVPGLDKVAEQTKAASTEAGTLSKNVGDAGDKYQQVLAAINSIITAQQSLVQLTTSVETVLKKLAKTVAEISRLFGEVNTGQLELGAATKETRAATAEVVKEVKEEVKAGKESVEVEKKKKAATKETTEEKKKGKKATEEEKKDQLDISDAVKQNTEEEKKSTAEKKKGSDALKDAKKAADAVLAAEKERVEVARKQAEEDEKAAKAARDAAKLADEVLEKERAQAQVGEAAAAKESEHLASKLTALQALALLHKKINTSGFTPLAIHNPGGFVSHAPGIRPLGGTGTEGEAAGFQASQRAQIKRGKDREEEVQHLRLLALLEQQRIQDISDVITGQTTLNQLYPEEAGHMAALEVSAEKLAASFERRKKEANTSSIEDEDLREAEEQRILSILLEQNDARKLQAAIISQIDGLTEHQQKSINQRVADEKLILNLLEKSAGIKVELANVEEQIAAAIDKEIRLRTAAARAASTNGRLAVGQGQAIEAAVRLEFGVRKESLTIQEKSNIVRHKQVVNEEKGARIVENIVLRRKLDLALAHARLEAEVGIKIETREQLENAKKIIAERKTLHGTNAFAAENKVFSTESSKDARTTANLNQFTKDQEKAGRLTAEQAVLLRNQGKAAIDLRNIYKDLSDETRAAFKGLTAERRAALTTIVNLTRELVVHAQTQRDVNLAKAEDERQTRASINAKHDEIKANERANHVHVDGATVVGRTIRRGAQLIRSYLRERGALRKVEQSRRTASVSLKHFAQSLTESVQQIQSKNIEFLSGLNLEKDILNPAIEAATKKAKSAKKGFFRSLLGGSKELSSIFDRELKQILTFFQKTGKLTAGQAKELQEGLNRTTSAMRAMDNQSRGAATGARQLAGGYNRLLKAVAGVTIKFREFIGRIIFINAIWKTWNLLLRNTRELLTQIVAFDQQLKNIQAITVATVQEIEKVGQAILNLAIRTPFAPDELGKAFTALGQAGFNASEGINALRAVAALSIGTLTDTQNSVKLITTSMRAFSVDTKKSIDVANILVSAVNRSKLTIEGLNTAFNFAAPASAAAGLSIVETASALGVMANQGIRFSTQGTGLRQVLAALIAPTDKFKAAVEGVGLSVEQLNPLTTDFGTILSRLKEAGFGAGEAFAGLEKRTAGAFLAMIRGADEFNRLSASLGGTQSALIAMSTQMSGLEKTFQRIKQRFFAIFNTNEARNFFRSLANIIEDLVIGLEKIVKKMGTDKDGVIGAFKHARLQLTGFVGMTVHGIKSITLFRRSLGDLGKTLLNIATLLLFFGAPGIAGKTTAVIGKSLGPTSKVATGLGSLLGKLAKLLGVLGIISVTVDEATDPLTKMARELAELTSGFDGVAESTAGARTEFESLLESLNALNLRGHGDSIKDLHRDLTLELMQDFERQLISKFTHDLRFKSGAPVRGDATTKIKAGGISAEIPGLSSAVSSNDKIDRDARLLAATFVAAFVKKLKHDSEGLTSPVFQAIFDDIPKMEEAVAASFERLKEFEEKNAIVLDLEFDSKFMDAVSIAIVDLSRNLDKVSDDSLNSLENAAAYTKKLGGLTTAHENVTDAVEKQTKAQEAFNVVEDGTDPLAERKALQALVVAKARTADVLKTLKSALTAIDPALASAILNVSTFEELSERGTEIVGARLRTTDATLRLALSDFEGIQALVLHMFERDATGEGGFSLSDSVRVELETLRLTVEEEISKTNSVMSDNIRELAEDTATLKAIMTSVYEDIFGVEDIIEQVQNSEALSDFLRTSLETLSTELTVGPKQPELLHHLLGGLLDTEAAEGLSEEVSNQLAAAFQLAAEKDFPQAINILEFLIRQVEGKGRILAKKLKNDIDARTDSEEEEIDKQLQLIKNIDIAIKLRQQELQLQERNLTLDAQHLQLELQLDPSRAEEIRVRLLKIEEQKKLASIAAAKADKKANEDKEKHFRTLIRMEQARKELNVADSKTSKKKILEYEAAIDKLKEENKLKTDGLDLTEREIELLQLKIDQLDAVNLKWISIAETINSDVNAAIADGILGAKSMGEVGDSIKDALKKGFKDGFKASLDEKLKFDKIFEGNILNLGEFTKNTLGNVLAIFGVSPEGLSGGAAGGVFGGLDALSTVGSGLLSGLGPAAFLGGGISSSLGLNPAGGALIGAGLALPSAMGAMGAQLGALQGMSSLGALTGPGASLAGIGATLGPMMIMLGAFLILTHFLSNRSVTQEFLKAIAPQVEAVFGSIPTFEFRGSRYKDVRRRVARAGATAGVTPEGINQLEDIIVDSGIADASTASKLKSLATAIAVVFAQGGKRGREFGLVLATVANIMTDFIEKGLTISEAQLDEAFDNARKTLGSFATVVEAVNKLLERGQGDIELYALAIGGAALVFEEDFPKGVDVARKALRQLRENGTVDLQALQSEISAVVNATQQFLSGVVTEPLKLAITTGDVGAATELLQANLGSGIQDTIITAVEQAFLAVAVQQGILTPLFDVIQDGLAALMANEDFDVKDFIDGIKVTLKDLIPVISELQNVFREALSGLADVLGFPISQLDAFFGGGKPRFLDIPTRVETTVKDFVTAFAAFTTAASDLEKLRSDRKFVGGTGPGSAVSEVISGTERSGAAGATQKEAVEPLKKIIYKSLVNLPWPRKSNGSKIDATWPKIMKDLALENTEALHQAAVELSRGGPIRITFAERTYGTRHRNKMYLKLRGSLSGGLIWGYGSTGGAYATNFTVTNEMIEEDGGDVTIEELLDARDEFTAGRADIETAVTRIEELTGVSRDDLNKRGEELFGNVVDFAARSKVRQREIIRSFDVEFNDAVEQILNDIEEKKGDINEALESLAKNIMSPDQFSAFFEAVREVQEEGIISVKKMNELIEEGLDSLQESFPQAIDVRRAYEAALSEEGILDPIVFRAILEGELGAFALFKDGLTKAINQALTSGDVSAGVKTFSSLIQKSLGDAILKAITEGFINQIFIQGLIGPFMATLNQLIAAGADANAIMLFAQNNLPALVNSIAEIADGTLGPLLEMILALFSEHLDGYNQALATQSQLIQEQLQVAELWAGIIEDVAGVRRDLLFGDDEGGNIKAEILEAQKELEKQLAIFRDPFSDVEARQGAAAKILALISDIASLGGEGAEAGLGGFQPESRAFQELKASFLSILTEVETAALDGSSQLDILRDQLAALEEIKDNTSPGGSVGPGDLLPAKNLDSMIRILRALDRDDLAAMLEDGITGTDADALLKAGFIAFAQQILEASVGAAPEGFLPDEDDDDDESGPNDPTPESPEYNGPGVVQEKPMYVSIVEDLSAAANNSSRNNSRLFGAGNDVSTQSSSLTVVTNDSSNTSITFEPTINISGDLGSDGGDVQALVENISVELERQVRFGDLGAEVKRKLDRKVR